MHITHITQAQIINLCPAYLQTYTSTQSTSANDHLLSVGFESKCIQGAIWYMHIPFIPGTCTSETFSNILKLVNVDDDASKRERVVPSTLQHSRLQCLTNVQNYTHISRPREVSQKKEEAASDVDIMLTTHSQTTTSLHCTSADHQLAPHAMNSSVFQSDTNKDVSTGSRRFAHQPCNRA